VLCADSVARLSGWGSLIDVLYLDSHDTNLPGHAEHGLAEISAAEHALHDRSLVVFDDTIRAGDGWLGKGRLAVPYLLGRGWQVLASGYQVVLGQCGGGTPILPAMSDQQDRSPAATAPTGT
jgi:hypothetical protein